MLQLRLDAGDATLNARIVELQAKESELRVREYELKDARAENSRLSKERNSAFDGWRRVEQQVFALQAALAGARSRLAKADEVNPSFLTGFRRRIS